MAQAHLDQKKSLDALELAEDRWEGIREALYDPEAPPEEEELGSLFVLLDRVHPTTPEERERLERLLEDIRQVGREFGFTPPPSRA